MANGSLEPNEEPDLSATAGGADTSNAGARMGLSPGSVVQELGWDEDVDDELRVQIEDMHRR